MLEKERRTGGKYLEELSSLLKELPLEGCRRECNPVTKEWGWKAPENKAFRISGHFIMNFKESEPMYLSPSVSSAEVLKEEYSKDYQKFLEKSHLDENKALELLADYINDEEDAWPPLEIPLKFFDGKWLVIPSEETKKPELFVKKDIDAFYENDTGMMELKDLASDSKRVTGCFFTAPACWIYWSQDYAEAVAGKYKVELIDSLEKEKKLFFAKPTDKENLCFPNGKFNTQDIGVSTRERQDEIQQKKNLNDFTEKNNDFGFIRKPFTDLLIAVELKKKIILLEKEKDKKPPRIFNEEEYNDDEF